VPAERVDRTGVPRTPDETYDVAVAATAPALAAGLAGVLAGLAVLHAVLLDAATRVEPTLAAAVSALVVGAAALVLTRRPVPDHLAHPLVAALVLVLVANLGAGLVLVGEPRQSTNLMLALVLAGVVLLSPRWMLGVLYLTWGVWAVGAVVIGPSPQWPHVVVGMVLATVLAVAVNHLRRGSVRALAESRADAESATVRDLLTGVANRRGLALVGAQMVELARRQGDAVHCLFVDVDDLKGVNDALGHACGDEVLVAVAAALKAETRATDIVARWGGDEFCVVGPGPGMPPLEIERRVRDNVARQQPVPPEAWTVQVSAGGAMLAPWDAGTLETLLGKADQEMYLRRSLRKEGPTPAQWSTPAE